MKFTLRTTEDSVKCSHQKIIEVKKGRIRSPHQLKFNLRHVVQSITNNSLYIPILYVDMPFYF